MIRTRPFAALVLLVAATAGAETRYVSDQLQLGLHERAAVDSTIVRLLPTGTRLEVLERDGDMVRVEIADGTSGWVDTRFLSESEPDGARVQIMEEELAGAQAALADAQAKLVALEQQAAESPAPVAPSTEGGIPSDALREMQQLAEENQRLKQQLAELEAVQRMVLEQPPAPAEPAPAVTSPATGDRHPLLALLDPRGWTLWNLVFLASVLLLAFGVGGWMVDWGVRRRHGGFRV